MKQLLPFLCAAMAAQTAVAQLPQNSSAVFIGDSRHVSRQEAAPRFTNRLSDVKQTGNTANKTTAATNRYYNQSDAIVEIVEPNLQDPSNTSVITLWHDSTIRQQFNTGFSTVNYSSINQYFDPIRSAMFNDVGTFPNEMRVSTTSPYRVDSVIFFAAYIRKANKAAIVDTLIMSVVADNGRYAITPALLPEVAPYLPPGKDTLFAFTVLNVDSINRAAFSGLAGGTRAFWKVPLTAAQGDITPATGELTLRRFAFAVPGGGFNVPAGNGFNVTATFKSGDTWVRNVDTVGAFNSWRPVTYGSSSGQMPYYYYDFGPDRNMSGLMFSTDSANYIPSVLIEAINTTAFRFEFHDVTAYVTCPTCNTLRVEAASQGMIGRVFPNPANGSVVIPVTLNKSADLSVTITNAMGQQLATQQRGRVEGGIQQDVEFATSHLPSGVYFYTVQAGNTKQTGRFVVRH